ncbi:chemotaxis protein CheW [Pirellulaceae bacterium SH501]
MQLATFVLGEESFAVPSLQVEEFFKAIPITKVWGADSRIDGLVNIRGRTAAVINMRTCFELSPLDRPGEMMLLETQSGLAEEAKKIGLKAFEEPIVLLVDAVSQIVSIDSNETFPSPAHTKQPFVEGVIQKQDRYFTLISTEKLIDEILYKIGETIG